MDRKKLMKLLASFLAVMMLFTILSRAADSAGLANVKTSSLQSMIIDHAVTGSGKVVQNREQAISVLADLTVESILVNEGDSVSKGDVLFEIDMEQLKEMILLKKQEIEKIDLQKGDNESKKQVDETKKENQLTRAQEDYSNAAAQGDYELAKAAQAVVKAQEKLNTYYSQQNTVSDDTVLTELTKACEEKEAVCQAAGKALEDLEKKIEREVNKALDEAEEKELKKVEEKVRKTYQEELNQARETAEQGQQEKDSTAQALQAYQQEKAEKEAQENSEQEQQLIDDLTDKQQAYNDAEAKKTESINTAMRGIQDASMPEGTDSTNEISDLDREKLVLELKKLKNLNKTKGKIYSPIDGVVTKVAVTTGDKTTGGTAVLMADTSQGMKFTAQISADWEKYIAKNDTVTLKAVNDGPTLENQKITSVKTDEENKDMLNITVLIPASTMEIGTAAEFESVRESKTYSACIPIQALRKENNQTFVYVIQESESVLGKENIVRKVEVTVLDKNEKYAALGEQSIAKEQKIIVESDKDISAGSRVRLEE